MTSRSQKGYDSSATVKRYLDIAVHLFFASKMNRYDKLKADDKKIFDHLYPDIALRSRISLVTQLGEALTPVAGSVVAAALGVVLLSGFLTWVALGLMVIRK